MEVRLLGPVEVRSGGETVRLGGSRMRTLLARLALDAGNVVSTDRLVDLLWGSRPPATATGQIHTAVWRLRSLLGPVIETLPAGYRVDLPPGATDVQRFQDLVTEGRAATADGRPEQGARLLSQALDLWRGDALSDVPALADHAQVLEQQRVIALEARIGADLDRGVHEEVVGELFQLTLEFPACERMHAHLMTALYRSGRVVDALNVYRRLERYLASELGLEPTPELRDLQRCVLTHDPSMAAPGADARVSVAGRA